MVRGHEVSVRFNGPPQTERRRERHNSPELGARLLDCTEAHHEGY
jgi:hypothetical protein